MQVLEVRNCSKLLSVYRNRSFFSQPNMDTRQKQMEGWCSLILSYCRHHKIFVLDLPGALSNSLPLFHNRGECSAELKTHCMKPFAALDLNMTPQVHYEFELYRFIKEVGHP